MPTVLVSKQCSYDIGLALKEVAVAERDTNKRLHRVKCQIEILKVLLLFIFI